MGTNSGERAVRVRSTGAKDVHVTSTSTLRIAFPNAHGDQLSARLEMPDGDPKAYALFAHCFTCGKDSSATVRISRALAALGVAVLRFDFTGLGQSGGAFADTNFSSNVADLIAAAQHMRETYSAPQLLIGHSLGGAAVIAAARFIPEAQAIATIGAPSEIGHVAAHFSDHAEEIEHKGQAEVALSGRQFTIKRQFIEDLQTHSQAERIARLKRPILIMHAPMDATVSVEHASDIFHAAKHPKSFVSLDGADHLLSQVEDATYAASMIATWSMRYIRPGFPR